MRLLRTILSDDFTVTKRQLGVLLMLAGGIVLAATVAAEIVNTQTSDFGTVQKLATLLGAISLAAGLAMLPLGDRPA